MAPAEPGTPASCSIADRSCWPCSVASGAPTATLPWRHSRRRDRRSRRWAPRRSASCPSRPERLALTAAQRGLGYLLLSDAANHFSRTCGLAYELSPAHVRIHRMRGRDLPAQHGDVTWRLPVPAAFVVEPSARVAFAFSDADSARWPDPDELLASLCELRHVPALSNR